MRTGIVLLAMLLVLFPWAPVQAQQDPYLITGTSFGPWQIGQPGGELLAAWSDKFGKPNETGSFRLTAQEERYFCWHIGYCVVTVEGRLLAIMVLNQRAEPYAFINRKYHTPEGIHIMSTLSDVSRAYGKPDKNWKEYLVIKDASVSPARSVAVITTGMTWKNRGLYLEISHDGHVQAIAASDFSAPWEECSGDLNLPAGCS